MNKSGRHLVWYAEAHVCLFLQRIMYIQFYRSYSDFVVIPVLKCGHY